MTHSELILNQQEISDISAYLDSQRLDSLQLSYELYDHFICLTEDLMITEGHSFNRAFEAAKGIICPNGAKEIEKEIQYLLTINKHIMLHKFIFVMSALGGVIFLLSIALGVGGILDIATSRLLTMCGILMITTFTFPYLMYRWYQKSKTNLKEDLAY